MNKISISEIIRNGGATLNKNGERVTFSDGFQVSRRDCYTLNAADVEKILDAMNSLLDEISTNEFCGLWVEGDLIYIDVSERIANRAEALRIGKARKQISIFDWSNGCCVYC